MMNRSQAFLVFGLCMFLSLQGRSASASDSQQASDLESAQQQWIETLKSNPSEPLLIKASGHNPFAKNFQKLRCWVEGFESLIGAQRGVCRGGGKKYAMSVLSLGISVGANFDRLVLKSNQPFKSHESLTGAHASFFVLVGAEQYGLSARDGLQVRGRGIGLGLEEGVDFAWLTLDEI